MWGRSCCLFSDKYKTHKYSCWMLNWWCITWPVGSRRLMSRYHFRLYTLVVRVAEGTLPWVHQADVAAAGNYLCEDVRNICYLLRAPDEADKNAAPISVSPDTLARLPAFFNLEAYFLRDRIFGCNCKLISFPKDLAILVIRSHPESALSTGLPISWHKIDWLMKSQ